MINAALIVAAGMSSRMGDFKPMLNIGSISIAQRVVATFQQAGVDKIVMITGYNATMLERHLSGNGIVFLRNEEYRSTQMFDSVCIGLHYLRDKMQREVDFLVSKDGKPFMLVECKSSGKEPLSTALVYFKKTLEVPLAWQVCFDMLQSGLDPTDAGLSPSRIAVADLLKVLV